MSEAADKTFGRLASDIPERKIDWLMPSRYARGKCHEANGDPGTAKTTAMIDHTARMTAGRPLPDGSSVAVGPVTWLSAEDAADDTLVPRLRVAGANMKLVRILPAAFSERGQTKPVTFPDHIAKIERTIIEDGTIALFIDPITAFLSEKTDSHNDASVRRVLAELRALAERTNCAVILVRHLNKLSGVDKALYRGGGSIAFSAAARISYLIAFDPTDLAPEFTRRRVIACVKSNLGPKPASLAFRLVADADEPAHVEWLPEPSPLTADDLLRTKRPQRTDALDEAISFLQDELSNGPKLSDEVSRRASELAISEATLRRARKTLDVQATKVGFRGDWYLALKEERPSG